MNPLSFEDKLRIIIMAQVMSEGPVCNSEGAFIGDPTNYLVEATVLYFIANGMSLPDTMSERIDELAMQLVVQYKNGDFAEVKF